MNTNNVFPKLRKEEVLIFIPIKSNQYNCGCFQFKTRDKRRLIICSAENKKWKKTLKNYFGRSTVPDIRNIDLKETCIVEVPVEKTSIAFAFLHYPPPAAPDGETITNFIIKLLSITTGGLAVVLNHATLVIHDGKVYPAKSRVGIALQHAAENNTNPYINALLDGP